MRRSVTLFTAVLLMFSALAVRAQEHDHGAMKGGTSPIRKADVHPDISVALGKMVTFASSPGNANGYLSLPKDKNVKHPAIIVIHEWWGLNEWVMQQSDRFAKQGYVTLAVDLYRGRVTSDPNVAHELMRGLPEDRAVNDLQAAFAYLATRSDVDVKRIGSIGWCMGGGYSLALAIAEPRLAAIVMNYGRLVTAPASIAKINAPLLGNFGGKDQGIPVADVNVFRDALKAAGKSVDIKVYPDSGHGFMNPNNSAGYVAADTADAQARIDAFFAKRLI